VFKVVLQIDRVDVSIDDEEMVKHGPGGYVGKTNHEIVQNVQIHWLKNSNCRYGKSEPLHPGCVAMR
jgi:hypothetical protein